MPGETLRWNQQRYSLDDLVRQLTAEGVSRVYLTSAPEATVHDFTLALSTLGDNGIEPRWMRSDTGDGVQ